VRVKVSVSFELRGKGQAHAREDHYWCVRGHSWAHAGRLLAWHPAAQNRSRRTGRGEVIFNLYATSQWAATYQLLSPAAQHAVSEATWAKAQRGCPNQGVQLAGTIRSVTLTGNTAVVRATPLPGKAGWVSTDQVFTYSEGRWGYRPYDLDIYRGHTIGQIVAALKDRGFCGI